MSITSTKNLRGCFQTAYFITVKVKNPQIFSFVVMKTSRKLEARTCDLGHFV